MTNPTQHTINTPYMVGPVHCYTVVRDGELVLFDTGPPTREAKEYLRKNVDLSSLAHVIVTHCHIDHYGLTSWLEQETDAIVYLPYRDCLKITHHDERMEQMYDFLLEVGFADQYIDELRKVLDAGVLFPPFPENHKVAEEAIPARLGIEAVPCPGHSQSDLVYVFDEWAVTGDTLLRGIFQSPLLDVELEAGKRFRNYDAYCASVVKLGGLRSKTILPGHRQAVESVEATLLFYISKMLLRVEQLLPFKDVKNVAKIIKLLFGDAMQEPFHIYLKASEIIFMQDFLQSPELLRTSLEKTGLFAAVEEQYRRVIH